MVMVMMFRNRRDKYVSGTVTSFSPQNRLGGVEACSFHDALKHENAYLVTGPLREESIATLQNMDK